MKKLRNKFLAYILLPAALILAIGAVLSFFVSHHIVRRQLEIIAEIGLQQAADEMDVDMGRARDSLLIIRDQMHIFNPQQDQLRNFFKKACEEELIETIFLVKNNGNVVANDEVAEIALKNAIHSKWYNEAMLSDRLVTSTPFISDYSGSLVNCLALRVKSMDGIIIGALGCHVPTEAILNKATKIDLVERFKDAQSGVIDQHGRYIVHSNERLVGRHLSSINDDMSSKILEALRSGKTFWSAVASSKDGDWFVGFQKSRFIDTYVLAMIPMSSAALSLHVHVVSSLVILIVSIVALLFILMRMAHKLAKPLNMLSDAAGILSKGAYPEPLPAHTEDELGDLVEAFNTMIKGLKQRDHIRSAFGRYLPEEVVERLLESEERLQLGGESREVTIMISDLRGFTAQTSNMAPQDVIKLLNRYLGAMIEIIMDHQGIVDEITGDGILAIFGAPVDAPDHPMQAVLAAVEMQAAMKNINHLNEEDGFPILQMGIGITTGSVVVGNIGSQRRTKYGAVGSKINMAGRIESYSVGGQILISESTYEKVKDLVKYTEKFTEQMKGFDTPVTVYDLGIMAGDKGEIESQGPDKLSPLAEPIEIVIKIVENKVVTSSKIKGSLTHLGEDRATVSSDVALDQWVNVILEITDPKLPGVEPVFAKSLGASSGESEGSTLLRFTYTPSETKRIFSEIISSSAG